MELLRGRDGLPGRDGVQGPPRPQGKDGSQGPPGPQSGGATYTRWGKSTCPKLEGTELVYSGIAGGTSHDKRGGGALHAQGPRVQQNISILYKGHMTTMFPVLYAMCLLDQQ